MPRTDRRKLKEAKHERFLEGVDARFRPAAVLRRRYEAIMDDLGGVESTSYMQRSLAKRFIALEARVESAEAAQVESSEPPMTTAEYMQAINTMTGITGKLGLKRRPKPVKSLHEHIAGRS